MVKGFKNKWLNLSSKNCLFQTIWSISHILICFSQVNVLEICLHSDALNVPSEEVVVESLLRWVQHDLQGRQKLLPDLLSLTRLHHLSSPTLKVWINRDALCFRMIPFMFFILSHFSCAFVSLSDPPWFRTPPMQSWVLSRSALRGSEQTGTVQWPARWCQTSHHTELHLYPQDRGEWRD